MRSIYHYRNLSFHFIAHILIYMPFFPCNHAWTICLGFAFLEIDMLGANIFMLVAGFQCWRDRAVSVETCDIFCQIWTRLQLPRLAFFLLWKFKLFSWHRIMFLSGALQLGAHWRCMQTAMWSSIVSLHGGGLSSQDICGQIWAQDIGSLLYIFVFGNYGCLINLHAPRLIFRCSEILI